MLKNEGGSGTHAGLRIRIPLEQVDMATESATPSPATRARRILVVDDEMLLVIATADTLRDLGHEPFEAGSGAQALELLRTHPEIEMMITDHAMPGMSGIALARKAHELRPDLKIVLASGYTRLREELDIPIERMPKPYQERDLAAVIARLYDGQP